MQQSSPLHERFQIPLNCYHDISLTRVEVAQILVRQLDEVVKEALRRRALRHGRSMEEEARLILAQAVAAEEAVSLSSVGLGSRMAALFSGATLEEPFGEWRGVAAVAAQFET